MVVEISSISWSVRAPRLARWTPTLPSGYYYVDPDVVNIADHPINVYCDMITGIITSHLVYYQHMMQSFLIINILFDVIEVIKSRFLNEGTTLVSHDSEATIDVGQL